MSLSTTFLALAAVTAAQTEISAAGPNGPLKGTLTRAAAASAPVVLIIPGSGPTDRDGNSPLGVRAATYRLLSEQLASRGVSTVRIDKRGMFASSAAGVDANAVTIEDYVRDTRAWVDTIRAQTGASCVWLLGHSEGGLVALATAQRDSGLCGLVLVAAAGRPLGDVLKDQLRANPANAALLEPAMAAIDSLAAGKRVDASALPPALAPLFNPAVQGFLISAFALDPAKLAGQVKKPMLIVQGERDIQVSVADAQALKAANPSASLLLLPDTNHVLKQVTSDQMGANVATYADPSLPLAPGIAEAIARFVAKPQN
jgi:pimeloyl-ACP methyl ester carboxylesterase